jgi:two-component system, chemotaxis family, chemotaxis protein CheY
MKVMIADDHTSTRMLLKELLTHAGHEIIAEADNGIDSLTAYFEKTPDLLILDNQMSKMNGVEVARNILKSDQKAQIIMCTANYEEISSRAIELGVMEVIAKPFNIHDLLLSVSQAKVRN